jgi:hypothetical protein
MVCTWIGVGVTYFSSASARVMGSAKPKSQKLVNEDASIGRAQAAMRLRCTVGDARHPA